METKRYGLVFPEHVNDASIELWCYRNNHTPDKGGLGKTRHMLNAISLLWPEAMPSGSRGHVMNKWTERRVKAWCEDEFQPGDADWQTWWGPSSSGKSTDAALIILTHWLSAPDQTTVTVCSTTKDMLEKRIFGEILRLYNLYQGKLPGSFSVSKNAILLGDENTKNGIFGIAVQKIKDKEALGNLIGVHNRFNVLVVDEMQAMRSIIMDATDNLSTGEEFKFLGMGNPESRLDLLGQHSEPKVGWKGINDRTGSWSTKLGKTHHFDGRDSPANENPKRFYFLINRKQRQKIAKRRGEDSPAYWSQAIGFVPPEGLTQTVLTESMIVQHNMMDPAEWIRDFKLYAGLDPAYSSGGDRCMMRPAAIGRFTNGVMGIFLMPLIQIDLRLTSGKPMTYYIQSKVQEECEKLGIPPNHLAVDVTGMQGMLVDVIEKEWGPGVHRVNFVGNATDLPSSVDDKRSAKEVYANRVTELWFNFSEYGRHGQIRGLDADTGKEFCQRQLLDKNLKVICIERKKDMKMRTGESPDAADATVCLCAYARERLQIGPGSGHERTKPVVNDDYAREYDVDVEQNSYLTSDV